MSFLSRSWLALGRISHNSHPTLTRAAFTLRSLPVTVTHVPAHGTQVRPSRTSSTTSAPIGGFSYPGPRKLADIAKLQLLDKHTSSGVSEIWLEYHKEHKTAVADTFSADAYRLLALRSKRCPLFVLPVPRDGGFFTLLVQFQGRQAFMTFLEDYKNNAPGAMPYLTLTFYEEMLVSKCIVLARAEVTTMLTIAEAKVLLELVKKFYLGEGKDSYEAVVAFNEKPDKFNFDVVLRAAGISK